MKICNKCRKELPAEMFHKNNQQADGRSGTCKYCKAVARKAWDHKYNQTAKARATAKRYYYSAKGQKTKISYRQSYEMTQEQRDRYRLAMRKHEKEQRYKARRRKYDLSPKGQATKAARDKRYMKTEKGRFSKRKVEIKRKHQIKSMDCTLTRTQWQAIKEAFNHACAYCKKPMNRLEMDHVIPLSKGGHHTAQNVVPACRTCNASKGNRNALNAVSGM